MGQVEHLTLNKPFVQSLSTKSSTSDNVNMAGISTCHVFSLLELAKARVLAYQLDTTDHLNPELNIFKDLEALRMLEGTYVVTTLRKEVSKKDKAEFTREERIALSEMQPSLDAIQMGQVLEVRATHLGRKGAAWILERASSSGNLPYDILQVCASDRIIGKNRRVSCGIEGRAIVSKVWAENVFGEEKMWIDQKGCLQLRNTSQNKWMHVSKVFIARRI